MSCAWIILNDQDLCHIIPFLQLGHGYIKLYLFLDENIGLNNS